MRCLAPPELLEALLGRRAARPAAGPAAAASARLQRASDLPLRTQKHLTFSIRFHISYNTLYIILYFSYHSISFCQYHLNSSSRRRSEGFLSLSRVVGEGRGTLVVSRWFLFLVPLLRSCHVMSCRHVVSGSFMSLTLESLTFFRALHSGLWVRFVVIFPCRKRFRDICNPHLS